MLLDAAVEGELELVKQIVEEVRNLHGVKIGCEVTEELTTTISIFQFDETMLTRFPLIEYC